MNRAAAAALSPWMASTALLLLALLPLTAQDRPAPASERPPVAEDLKALLEVVRTVEESARAGGRGVGGMLLRVAPADAQRMTALLRERGTPELLASLPEGAGEAAIRALFGEEGLRAPAQVRTGTLPDGTPLAEVEVRVRARGSSGDGHPLLLGYRRTAEGWRLDRVPETVLEELPARAVAPHAPFERVTSEVSPLLVLRHYAAGAVPDAVRADYAERGIALPADQRWSDVTWRGEPVHYPGCDSLGRTDPWRPGQPDAWAELDGVIREQWFPALTLVETEDGTTSAAEPVTLDAAADAPAELLVGALRVFARDTARMPSVRLRVAPAPGFLARSVIELNQPVTPEEQALATRVAAGLHGEVLKQALLEAGLTECVGVQPGAGHTVQDVVTTLDALLALGVEDLFVAALPAE